MHIPQSFKVVIKIRPDRHGVVNTKGAELAERMGRRFALCPSGEMSDVSNHPEAGMTEFLPP